MKAEWLRIMGAGLMVTWNSATKCWRIRGSEEQVVEIKGFTNAACFIRELCD